MVSVFALPLILAVVAAYVLLSKRLERSVFTLPIVFTTLGLALATFDIPVLEDAINERALEVFAEVTLVLLLFGEAARVRWGSLRGFAAIPARMLLIGMPLTLLAGTIVVYFILPDGGWPIALLTAAILTPTDAALGQAVISSPRIPHHLRETLEVESGLNDGLAFPAVVIAASFALTLDEGFGPPSLMAVDVTGFIAAQLTFGPLVGAAVGGVAALLLNRAARAGWCSPVGQGLYFLITGLLSYALAEAVGGNGFIAAFVGGIVFGNLLRVPTTFIHDFMDGEGRLLMMASFLVFGAVLAPIGLAHIDLVTLLVAVLFLTVIRMVPVALSLVGTGLGWRDRMFLGWFGPRGLASILFALLVVQATSLDPSSGVFACVVLTVLLSIVLHGVSAYPAARSYTPKAPDTG